MAQQPFQIFRQTEKPISQSCLVRIKLKKKIDVAACRLEAPTSCRAEEFKFAYPILPAQGSDLLAMLFEERNHHSNNTLETDRSPLARPT